MSRYRILEKKGHYAESASSNCRCQMEVHQKYHGVGKVYIPRYIVQEYSRTGYAEDYKDLQEFTDLDEARKFKNDLELEEGRVIDD